LRLTVIASGKMLNTTDEAPEKRGERSSRRYCNGTSHRVRLASADPDNLSEGFVVELKRNQ
jgi:hypothetical protein